MTKLNYGGERFSRFERFVLFPFFDFTGAICHPVQTFHK